MTAEEIKRRAALQEAKTHLEPYAGVLVVFEREIRKRSEESLLRLIEMCDMMSEINCSSYTYQASKIIKPIAERQLKYKKV